MKKLVPFISLIVSLIIMCSCLHEITNEDTTNEDDLESASIPSNFCYSTSREISISITAPELLKNAVFSLETYKTGSDSSIFATGTFCNNLTYEAVFSIPIYIDTLKLISLYTGLISELILPIENDKVSIDLTQYYNRTYATKRAMAKSLSLKTKSTLDSRYTYMGTYDALGVPDYLVAGDELEQSFLDKVNAALPLYQNVMDLNPQYIEYSEKQINLIKDADVWVTFVTESANFQNALGYYSYPTDNPPSSQEEIDSLTIIFPNTSRYRQGGGLYPGDKVYLGKFEANTTIGWFLISRGWTGDDVDFESTKFYSTKDFNPESDPDFKDHVVSLLDEELELVLVGIEDKNRESGCDNDFNDVLFCAAVSPFNAIDRDGTVTIDSNNEDTDGDGVCDVNDEYPNDANKAFNNSSEDFGTLAFEDLWPSKGDYDFNDLIVDYNFNLITNANNLVTTIDLATIIRHVGGSLSHGVAFVLPVESSKVKEVINQVLVEDYATVGANGVEQGVDETVIFIADNVRGLLGDTINIEIELSEGISIPDLGAAPYNPFMIVNNDRGREVHLPDEKPTSLADYLGTYNDDSDPSSDRYYKTNNNLPWAISVYEGFTVPEEKVSIDKQYPYFLNWITSGGVENQDWYLYYSY